MTVCVAAAGLVTPVLRSVCIFHQVEVGPVERQKSISRRRPLRAGNSASTECSSLPTASANQSRAHVSLQPAAVESHSDLFQTSSHCLVHPAGIRSARTPVDEDLHCCTSETFLSRSPQRPSPEVFPSFAGSWKNESLTELAHAANSFSTFLEQADLIGNRGFPELVYP